MTKCPHSSPQFCPLYVASHYGSGIGCMDDQIHEGTCAVARGMDYASEVEKVNALDPVLVARCEWNKMKESRGKSTAH